MHKQSLSNAREGACGRTDDRTEGVVKGPVVGPGRIGTCQWGAGEQVWWDDPDGIWWAGLGVLWRTEDRTEGAEKGPVVGRAQSGTWGAGGQVWWDDPNIACGPADQAARGARRRDPLGGLMTAQRAQ